MGYELTALYFKVGVIFRYENNSDILELRCVPHTEQEGKKKK